MAGRVPTVVSTPYRIQDRVQRVVRMARHSHQSPVKNVAAFHSLDVGLWQLFADRARPGGSYSAISQINIIGPEAGLLLVDKTVEFNNELWK